MSSCLTAFYRLNTRHVIHSLIPECSSEKAPIAFKLVLVTCFYTIASEEDRLPWNPSIQPASSALGAPLRKLFAENVVRERVADVLARKTISDRKLKRQNVELAKDKQELIIYLLKMYQIDPVLAVAVSRCLILDRSISNLALVGTAQFETHPRLLLFHELQTIDREPRVSRGRDSPAAQGTLVVLERHPFGYPYNGRRGVAAAV